ncbi:MAG: SusC/RagA family TonB-linked outer membrane protein [Mangrovibacterium sp.]
MFFLICGGFLCLLLLPGWLAAQNLVKGTVTDESGGVVVGASVAIKGTTIGTVTDRDGNFNLNLTPDQKILIVSFIGYETTEVAVNGQSILNIVIREKDQSIGEVQVVGFGEQRKESVIGSISSVSVGDLKTPVGNVSSSLAGKMAGIVAVQRSGEPGAGADFWIRGVSTFGANNRPLVLVDGIERPLDLVEVEDIESFSILKDATATAVYGVRGANGVVLVTTRKGKEGKPAINIKAENGFLSPTRMPKMANAEQFIDLYNEVYSEDNNGRLFYSEEDKQKYLDGSDPDLYPNVNWMDEIYKDMTTSRRVTANITGGTPMIRFYVSGSVYKENGIFNAEKGLQYNPSLDWTRYNFRSNVDINLHRTTVLNLSLSTQYDVKNKPDTDVLWIYSFLTVPIAIPKVYSDGSIARPPIGENPYNLLNNTGYVQLFNNNSQSLISLTQDFSELVTTGLKANVKFSWDAVNSATTSRYKSPSTYYATGRDADGNLILQKNNDGNDYMSLWAGHSGERVIYLEGSVTYDHVFREQHRVGGLILFNMRERINNFPVANEVTSAYLNSLPYRNVGIAGRATYSYKDTYFVEGNFGYNGSENFSPGKQLGFFPSLALGYLLSNEDFFKTAFPSINLLKLKGSWGTVGNDKIQAGKRRFAFNSEMREYGSYTFGESGQNWISGLGTGYPGNPNVSWERAEKFNLGLEYGMFNKLTVQVDYFRDKRDHIFIERTGIASIVGIPVRPQVNLGRLENKGWETTLEYDDKIGELLISAKANVTFNRNKTLYNDNPPPIMAYRNVVNKPLYQQFGLIALGYFESEEDIANSPVQQYGPVRPGDIKFRDINGDGVVNDNDIVAIGRTHVPEVNYGFGFSLAYHGFDLSLHFQGVGNFTNFMDGSPVNGFENANLFLSGVYADVAENRWTLENPDPNAKYPRMSIYTNQNNKQLSTKKQFNSRFMRLKNAEFGYTIPKQLTSRVGFSSVRFYLQGVNVFTWSKFKLWDPELNDSQGAVYPNMRVINAGVNVNL